jgi:methylated-DNA-[protein]-cysteine S-methyltransferase
VIIAGVVDSDFGPLQLAASPCGVVGLEMRTTTDGFRAGLRRRLGVAESDLAPALGPTNEARRQYDQARDQLLEYAAGERTVFTIALELSGVSDWDRRILGGVRSIPFGSVTSYGRLAGLAGSRGAARAAGGAVRRNPIGLLIPCHRVIAGDGSIGGYGGSWFADREELLALKRALLAHEGVTVPTHQFVG